MLDRFSHAWLLFVFHLNGNAAAKSKIPPPRLDGEKVGLYATRTPHRRLARDDARAVAELCKGFVQERQRGHARKPSGRVWM